HTRQPKHYGTLSESCEELYTLATEQSIFDPETISNRTAEIIRAAAETGFDEYIKDIFLELKGLSSTAATRRNPGLDESGKAKNPTTAMKLAEARSKNRVLANTIELLKEQVDSRTKALQRHIENTALPRRNDGEAAAPASPSDITVREFSHIDEYLDFREN